MPTEQYTLGLESRDRVNRSFGGGFPSGSVVLIEGPHGSGKSVFAQRFAYGFCESGIYTGVVSSEMPTRQFIRNMRTFDYDIIDHFLNGQMLYYYVNVNTHIQSFDREIGRTSLLNKLFTKNPIWDGDVVLIDGFDEFLWSDPEFDALESTGDADHTMSRLTEILERITRTGQTIILFVNPELVTDRALYPLRDSADVYIQLEKKRLGTELQHAAIVERFTGIDQPTDDVIQFMVRSGRGLVIETKTIS